MNNTTRLATIDSLVARFPKFECRQGCADCCGPVIMSRLEMQRICARTGKTAQELDFMTVLQSEDQLCPLLDRQTNRCTVYDIRPAICKAFGASQHKRLLCPHGCAPETPLSAEQTDWVISQTEHLGHGFPAHSHALPTLASP